MLNPNLLLLSALALGGNKEMKISNRKLPFGAKPPLTKEIQSPLQQKTITDTQIEEQEDILGMENQQLSQMPWTKQTLEQIPFISQPKSKPQEMQEPQSNTNSLQQNILEKFTAQNSKIELDPIVHFNNFKGIRELKLFQELFGGKKEFLKNHSKINFKVSHINSNDPKEIESVIIKMKRLSEVYTLKYPKTTLNDSVMMRKKAVNNLSKNKWNYYDNFLNYLKKYQLDELSKEVNKVRYSTIFDAIQTEVAYLSVNKLQKNLSILEYNNIKLTANGIRIIDKNKHYNEPIIFVRHGKTRANLDSMFQGVSDENINHLVYEGGLALEYAKKVVSQLEQEWKGNPPKEIVFVTTNLSRSKESAKAIHKELLKIYPHSKFSKLQHPFLSEYDWGSMSNKNPNKYSLDEVVRSFLVFEAGNPFVKLKSGESVCDCLPQNLIGINSMSLIAKHDPDKTYILVGHAIQGSVIGALTKTSDKEDVINILDDKHTVKNGQVIVYGEKDFKDDKTA